MGLGAAQDGWRVVRPVGWIEDLLRKVICIIGGAMIAAGIAATPFSALGQPAAPAKDTAPSDFRKLELEAIENGLKDAEANRAITQVESDWNTRARERYERARDLALQAAK